MKKLFITIAAILLGAAFASAQDLASVTETFNNGAIALQADNKTEALQSFREALAGAELLGAEGEEIAAKCKSYIPVLEFSIAKEMVNNQDYDNAVAALKATIDLAKEYGDHLFVVGVGQFACLAQQLQCHVLNLAFALLRKDINVFIF